MKLFLAADKTTYTPREPITFTLRAVNDSSNPVRLSFRTSQRFDLFFQDAHGREVWRWSAGRVFAQLLGEETLSASGGQRRFQVTVEREFSRGVYTVTGMLPALEGGLSARTTVTIK